MTTLFTQASSSLVNIQNAVCDHLLSDCGMDTISHLPDPENFSTMTILIELIIGIAP